jgi:hypothetical protein
LRERIDSSRIPVGKQEIAEGAPVRRATQELAETREPQRNFLWGSIFEPAPPKRFGETTRQ